MNVRDKYNKLISLAQQSGVSNLSISEENNVLHISGSAPSDVKDKLWNLYNQIDPDMRSGDLVMNIQTTGYQSTAGETYEVKQGDNLSRIAQKYPGVTWREIYEANKDQIKDPDKIFPGQKIKIPQ